KKKDTNRRSVIFCFAQGGLLPSAFTVAMALPGDSGAGAYAMAKQLKVLMPHSFHKLRIADELAGCLEAGTGGGEGTSGPTALLVSPFGKVWRVEVGRDGDGAFLGNGWAEFLAAHGVGVGWFVVLRHEGGGTLTVKAFDTNFCIKDFGAPVAAMASRSSKGISCKPQFIRIIFPNSMEKMKIPARFLKDHVTEEYLNKTAVILSPLGKFWQIELENDQSGMFFTGGWSQFLEFHGMSKGDVLLLRYEGNMVFKFKAFGLNGCQKNFKNENAGIQQDIEMQQKSHSPFRKRKSNNEKLSSKGNKRRKSPLTSLNKKLSLKGPDYQIGPPSWIRKEINTYALEKLLALSIEFCHKIGFCNTCTITLKTEMDSASLWQVRGAAYDHYCCIHGDGWKSFCQENRVKTGDLCTFNVMETTLWHVTIARGAPSSSSRENKTRNGSSSSEGPIRPKGSMTSLSKRSTYNKSVFEIEPKPWIQKEMNFNSINKHLSLSLYFCDKIGLWRGCTITLKTSTSSRSWQRIPDELAEEIGAEEAVIVVPAGGKVKFWHIEVGQDGDGYFLGRGWPEFAEACGVGAGWFLILRHRGRGVLTAKAFDAACCLRGLGAAIPPAAVNAAATTSSKDSTQKPQFIRVLRTDFMKKNGFLIIMPTKFVQQYIPKEHLNNHMAIIVGPIGKVYNIKLEMGRSDVFFAGGWSQFLKFHSITEANVLLLRYEGTMSKVFEPDGCQREFKHRESRERQISTLAVPDIEEQQETPSASNQKCYKNNLPSSNGEKNTLGSINFLKKASFKGIAYEIGPPSWIKKQITAYTLENFLVLPKAFCDAIGFREHCTITLNTSRDGSRSWQVDGLPCKNSNHLLGQGWKRFCQENGLKEGDVCTFNVIESTMWDVIITHNIQEQQETAFASNKKRKRRNDNLSSEDQKKRKGSIISLKNASCADVYEIGPPAWIKKEITTNAIKRYIALSAAFCHAIGLREACTITLKTALSSTSSWQVRVSPYRNTNHQVGSGWRRFCRENEMKEGDICTFNVVEPMLWHEFQRKIVPVVCFCRFYRKGFFQRTKRRNQKIHSDLKNSWKPEENAGETVRSGERKRPLMVGVKLLLVAPSPSQMK
ncbi:hypothetical protein U9M48_031926, partial [Paspalum notatum var. saurae]